MAWVGFFVTLGFGCWSGVCAFWLTWAIAAGYGDRDVRIIAIIAWAVACALIYLAVSNAPFMIVPLS